MFVVKPAKCELVTSDTPIAEVLRDMRELDQTYVIVENENGKLVGILTNKDIVKRFHVFADPCNNSRPVSTVMTTPVKCLPVDMIHTVAEFMNANDVLHAPIVSRKGQLQGVITAKAILEGLVKSNNLPPIYSVNENISQKLLGVLSPDGSLHDIVDKVFEKSKYIGVDRLYFADMQNEAQILAAANKYDAILIDLDDAPEHGCVNVVKTFAENSDLETVCLAYTKSKHTDELQTVLQKFATKGTFFVYTKPLDFASMISDLESEWN